MFRVRLLIPSDEKNLLILDEKMQSRFNLRYGMQKKREKKNEIPEDEG